MIDIINELIDIEKQADTILSSAEHDKQLTPEIIELINAEIKSKVESYFANDIFKLQTQIETETVNRLSEINFATDKHITKMLSDFENYKSVWAEQMFEEVLRS